MTGEPATTIALATILTIVGLVLAGINILSPLVIPGRQQTCDEEEKEAKKFLSCFLPRFYLKSKLLFMIMEKIEEPEKLRVLKSDEFKSLMKILREHVESASRILRKGKSDVKKHQEFQKLRGFGYDIESDLDTSFGNSINFCSASLADSTYQEVLREYRDNFMTNSGTYNNWEKMSTIIFTDLNLPSGSADALTAYRFDNESLKLDYKRDTVAHRVNYFVSKRSGKKNN